MSILVFVEHHGSELQKGSLGVLTKAASLGDPDVAAVLVGGGVKALAPEAAKYGASKVFVVEDDALEPPLPQPRVDALAKVIEDNGYETVLIANSVLAADVAAGLAARCRIPSSSRSAGSRLRASRSSAPARSTRARTTPGRRKSST
jgi:electron transfer flavoprotein alpha subunit